MLKNDELVVYGICPVHADEKDEEMMAQMSEFLHRANYGLKNGCLSLITRMEKSVSEVILIVTADFRLQRM